MDFRPFPKTPTRVERAPGGRWVATEKVHGAHLVVAAADDGGTRFGKRKDWLAPDAPFFGWQLLSADLGGRVAAVARAVGSEVHAHGELCGGGYPHPDVAPVPGLSPVQTSVWYAPDVRWALFAIRVGQQWLAWHEVEALAVRVGLELVPVVARGTRTDLDRLPVRAPTRVPARLGLPPIEGNVGEGLVLVADARMPAEDRAAVKRKIPELDDDRFGEGRPHDPGDIGFPGLLAWAGRLVNPARIASARSKVGVAPAAVADEVALDVAEDLRTAFPDAWGRLGDDEWALIEAIRTMASSSER